MSEVCQVATDSPPHKHPSEHPGEVPDNPKRGLRPAAPVSPGSPRSPRGRGEQCCSDLWAGTRKPHFVWQTLYQGEAAKGSGGGKEEPLLSASAVSPQGRGSEAARVTFGELRLRGRPRVPARGGSTVQ